MVGVSNDLKPQSGHVPVIVRSITLMAKDIVAVEFMPEEGVELPAFSAGAHIDLILPDDIRRSYSLCNPPSDRQRYVIGVKKASPSGGASAYVHDHLRVGQNLLIGLPRNNFPLDATSRRSIFIAGGIGITPIWSMIQKLEAERGDWKLYYAARTRRDAAFCAELEAMEKANPGRVDIRFDHEPGVAMLDLAEIVANHSGKDTHFYACGPGPLLDAFEMATGDLPAACRHLERFTADLKPASDEALSHFEVVLARSGITLQIGPEKSILDAMLDAGVHVDFSCMEGICGSCKVEVLDGVPDHRDVVLTDEERARQDAMLVCSSGSRSHRLVLNI